MPCVQLDGIEPFNDSVFNNCTYPIHFAALRYYRRPIIPLVLNEDYRFACEYDSEYGRSLLICTTHSVVEMDELLTNTLGVSRRKQLRSANVIADLEHALAGGWPVMLMIDRYHQPLVHQYYRREHFLHAVLVYGYDDVGNVISFFDDLCHHSGARIVACRSSCEEITQAYASCHEVWDHQLHDVATFVSFVPADMEPDADEAASQARDGFIRHVLDHRSETEESVNRLGRFSELFREEVLQNEPLTMLRGYYHVFRRMTEMKETQRYQSKCLFDENASVEKVMAGHDTLVRAWNLLRIRTMRASAHPGSAELPAYASDVFSKLQELIRLEKAQQCAYFEALDRAVHNPRGQLAEC
jgi:hypothetical protein